MSVSASFPVLFFDGERETEIGDVVVHPSTGYRSFVAVIAQRIGISPHQIVVSLVVQQKSHKVESSRRIGIDDYTNFADVVREKDGFFQAVLKRSSSRRARRRHAAAALSPQSPLFSPEKVHLRRDVRPRSPDFGRISPPLGLLEYERLLELQRQKELYLLSTSPYAYGDGFVFPALVANRMPAGITVCEECLTSKETPIPFHSCVYDTVTECFRSKAGPVQRPSKPHCG